MQPQQPVRIPSSQTATRRRLQSRTHEPRGASVDEAAEATKKKKERASDDDDYTLRVCVSARDSVL